MPNMDLKDESLTEMLERIVYMQTKLRFSFEHQGPIFGGKLAFCPSGRGYYLRPNGDEKILWFNHTNVAAFGSGWVTIRSRRDAEHSARHITSQARADFEKRQGPSEALWFGVDPKGIRGRGGFSYSGLRPMDFRRTG